jgi:hypothetical protein
MWAGQMAGKRGIMLRTPSLIIVFALTAGTVARAQLPPQPPMPGSQQEHAACSPDVMRFCRELLPADRNAPADTFAIANCLQQHRSRISVACNAVLSGHGR